MDPCIDYCYNRFGKEYTENCNNNCEYAKAIAENKKLQEILKELKCDNINLTGELAKIFDNMTVAIKTLYAENKKLREKIEDACLDGYAKGLGEMSADLTRVMAERDAAISDLTCIARTYPVELCDDLVCQYCKHYPNINAGCPGWTDDDCFEWRGIKKEG